MDHPDTRSPGVREVAGQNALHAGRLRSGEEVLLKVSKPWDDGADHDVDACEGCGEFLGPIRDIPSADLHPLGGKFASGRLFQGRRADKGRDTLYQRDVSAP